MYRPEKSEKRSDKDVFTFEEYMSEFGLPSAEDEVEERDDPEEVGGEIAKQIIEIIRQGLRQTQS
jgi:hypothetical protein